MNIRISSCLLVWCAVMTWAGAETWQGTGAVSFSVKATGHTVKGEVDLAPFEVVATESEGGPVLTWTSRATILDMKTGKEKRDKEMHHTLHAEDHPEIHGTASEIALGTLQGTEETPATLPFTFSLADVELEYEATVTHLVEEEGTVSFTASFVVSQVAHGLKPIRKMAFLKVKDPVHVDVAFSFTK